MSRSHHEAHPHTADSRSGDAPAGQGMSEVTRKNIRTMRELEQAALDRRTRADRVAAFVAAFCGSMPFVWLHVVWFGIWIAVNALPGLPHFDPYPFTFLTLVVSLEAIFLSTFILISQNYEMRISDRRNELDLQINLLSEQENTKMLQMLERIAEKVGAATGHDPEIRALEEATQPSALVEQLEQMQCEDIAAEKKAAHSGDGVPAGAAQTNGG